MSQNTMMINYKIITNFITPTKEAEGIGEAGTLETEDITDGTGKNLGEETQIEEEASMVVTITIIMIMIIMVVINLEKSRGTGEVEGAEGATKEEEIGNIVRLDTRK